MLKEQNIIIKKNELQKKFKNQFDKPKTWDNVSLLKEKLLKEFLNKEVYKLEKGVLLYLMMVITGLGACQ